MIDELKSQIETFVLILKLILLFILPLIAKYYWSNSENSVALTTAIRVENFENLISKQNILKELRDPLTLSDYFGKAIIDRISVKPTLSGLELDLRKKNRSGLTQKE